MEMKNLIRDCLNESLLENGFIKNKKRWEKVGDQVISIIDLQKSNYGESFYINVGFDLLEAGARSRNMSHVQLRLEDLVTDKEYYKIITDLSSDIQETKRFKELNDLFSEKLIPWLMHGISLTSLKNAYRKGELRNAIISKRAKEILSQD